MAPNGSMICLLTGECRKSPHAGDINQWKERLEESRSEAIWEHLLPLPASASVA